MLCVALSEGLAHAFNCFDRRIDLFLSIEEVNREPEIAIRANRGGDNLRVSTQAFIHGLRVAPFGKSHHEDT